MTPVLTDPSRLDYLRLNPQAKPNNSFERRALDELRTIVRSLFHVSPPRPLPPTETAERLLCEGGRGRVPLVVGGEEVEWREQLLVKCKWERQVAR